MALGLGIDTGGTYTDGVIYDFDSARVVAREKRLTTPHNLSEGICALLGAFDLALVRSVEMVALSTTLATNACVEGRGGRAALILMGYDRALVGRLSEEYGLSGAEQIHFISGAHNQRGGVAEQVGTAEVDQVARELRDRVDAVGVVEYWGVRDPSFEKMVKDRVRAATGLPVAAAHEMTGEINSMRRAASALVNARLIPLIDELLVAVREGLNRLGVNARMMVVRGDGSLMTEKFAREYPVETMLSGPASSVAGAMRLSGLKDMIAVDIGGTTTDLSVVRGGRARLMREGVDVGDFHTGTRAVDIHTIGLGGDSAIEWTARDGLRLSPVRALPLCQLASRYPSTKEILRQMASEEKTASYARGTFFLRNRPVPPYMELDSDEARALEALAGGPLSIEALADALRTRPYFIRLGRLERLGVLLRSTLTPTDAMHILGTFVEFDAEASRLGVTLLAAQADMTEHALVDAALDMAGEKLHRLIARALMGRMVKKPIDEPRTMHLGYHPEGDEMRIDYRVRMPIVGIGAPAGLMLKRAAARLDAELKLPEDFGVANAVGAITGSVVAEEHAHIRPIYDALGISGYSAHTSTGQYRADGLEECVAWAECTIREEAVRRAAQMGAADPAVGLERADSTGQVGNADRKLTLEVELIARATGRVSLS